MQLKDILKMSESGKLNILKKSKTLIVVSILLLINFLLRIFIWNNTELFRFSDYAAYLGGVEKLTKGESQYLLDGNFLFAISYIGYFVERVFGSLDFFFVFNCLIATLTGLILYFLVVKVTGMTLAGIITIVIQTLYTEYMVFSSVFYTPVIMIFLLSLFLLLLYFYYNNPGRLLLIIISPGLITVFLLTFFFKPELKFLSWFLIVFSLFFVRINRLFFLRTIALAFLLLTTYFLLNTSELITRPSGHVYSNSFVFFGHTDYGGDGGEGSFVYPANKAKYEKALAEYCKANNITNPTVNDYNSFQRKEIKNFITHHPLKWVNLQFKKFFRTFGVVPETTSFKILYTGLFKGNLWLTSIIIVAPVALIIILCIALFNFSSIKKLFNPSTFQPFNSSTLQCFNPSTPKQQSSVNGFLIIYFTLFIYYLIATIFYGQYQERYRIPVMVIFIVPALGYFIATFNRQKFFNKRAIAIKGVIVLLFLVIWTFQAERAITNKERFKNAIESISKSTDR